MNLRGFSNVKLLMGLLKRLLAKLGHWFIHPWLPWHNFRFIFVAKSNKVLNLQWKYFSAFSFTHKHSLRFGFRFEKYLQIDRSVTVAQMFLLKEFEDNNRKLFDSLVVEILQLLHLSSIYFGAIMILVNIEHASDIINLIFEEISIDGKISINANCKICGRKINFISKMKARNV